MRHDLLNRAERAGAKVAFVAAAAGFLSFSVTMLHHYLNEQIDEDAPPQREWAALASGPLCRQSESARQRIWHPVHGKCELASAPEWSTDAGTQIDYILPGETIDIERIFVEIRERPVTKL